jgi:hypothetical protein
MLSTCAVVQRQQQQQLPRLEPGAHEPLGVERHGVTLAKPAIGGYQIVYGSLAKIY